MNQIRLSFKNSISFLAGNRYGYTTYIEQVRDEIKWDEINEIIIPEHIKNIAISFVQGFIRDIVKKIPRERIQNHFVITSKYESVKIKFVESIKF